MEGFGGIGLAEECDKGDARPGFPSFIPSSTPKSREGNALHEN